MIVPFNRALYAQLAQQQFQPPRGYPLPSPTSPGFKAADLGMKLTCGFEMVMAKRTSGETAFCLLAHATFFCNQILHAALTACNGQLAMQQQSYLRVYNLLLLLCTVSGSCCNKLGSVWQAQMSPISCLV